MTEHSKIPVPEGEQTPPDKLESTRSPSLIERAAERFDFGRYIARAVPPVDARPARRPANPSPIVEAEAPPAMASETAALADVPAPQAHEPVAEPLQAAPVQPDISSEEAPAFSAERLSVDREGLRDRGLIVPEGSVTALLEEFRIVKRQLLLQAAELRRQGAGSMAQRVLVSSPHPNEGKTYCAVNLALSIAAEKDSDVLLVDADFAKPSVLSSLDLPGGPGLMDALMDEDADVASFVLGTDIPGLWVLPAGDMTINDSEYLASSRTERVLERLTRNAPNRIVIFDSPPALAASPAAELAKYVGQAIVIARADSTGQGALEDAVSLLSSCPNIQLLLNAAQFSPSGRRFGSYYGYGS